MKNFVIQTINGEIPHDFSFHLMKAIEYQNWYANEKIFDFSLEEKPSLCDGVAIGSLDFVFECMNKKNVKPLNVPKELFNDEFLKRKAEILPKKDISLTKPLFLKSSTKYKSFVDIVTTLNEVPDDTYLVSEVVEIESEWRSFIYEGKLVGLQNYAGDFTLFPDVGFIQKAIQVYRNAPRAYTLDVGISDDKGTFVIEVHPFVSCGLYGFSDYRILPQMMIAGYNSINK